MSGWEGKKEDCMQVQEVEGERQKEMEIVHVCQEILKLLTAGMGVKGEQWRRRNVSNAVSHYHGE